MPTFDRAAAKAAGWSDQEIEAAIAAGPPPGMAGTRDGAPRGTPSPAPMGYQGAPDDPLEGDLGLMDPLNLPATIQGGRAIYGLGRAAIEALPAVGKTLLAGGRAVGRRVLGKGNFDDLAKEVGSAARGPAPPTPPAPAPQPFARPWMQGPAAAPKPAPRPIAKAAPPATRTPPPKVTTTKGKVAAKITPAKGTAESRVSKPKPKPAKPPKKNAVGTAESRTRPRGASTPELERRAAARAKATGKNPPATGDNLESQLQRSVQIEDQMNALGMDEMQKAATRTIFRQGTPQDISQLMQLLGGLTP